MWVVQAVYLLVLLPSEILLLSRLPALNHYLTVIVSRIKAHQSHAPIAHHDRDHNLTVRSEARFDIMLAASQFSADVLANILVLIGSPHSAPAFVTFMTVSVFCSGAMPVMNSVGASLLIHTSGGSSKSGQLYAAMSVLAAITHAVQVGLFCSSVSTEYSF
jgi:hypothetical protein